jgi:hypothetical protein
MLWCWRCKMEVPMLDEAEYAEVFRLYTDSIQQRKQLCREKSLPLGAMPLREMFKPVRTRYEEITGMTGCHENAIVHHRLSLYGDLCENCKKPLRTPKARLCGSCMFPVRRAAW